MKGVILLNENMHALGYENPLTLAGGCLRREKKGSQIAVTRIVMIVMSDLIPMSDPILNTRARDRL
jgi:hypothetical protein